MGAWPEVVTLGEVLIDFVPTQPGLPIEHVTVFERAPGGAPANVAVGASRLGAHTAFIGKIADDPFGRYLRETLAGNGVDLRGLVTDSTTRTPLAFVGSDGAAGRMFLFYHDRMADTLLRAEELDRDLITHARVFHFGSVTLSAEPGRSATLTAARIARENGRFVSFDPNVRLELWSDPSTARAYTLGSLDLVDALKVSADELEFLTDSSDPVVGSRRLRERGPALVVVTLGPQGCYFEGAAGAGYIQAPHVETVDTLGAGDAFVAGLLYQLCGEPPRLILQDGKLLVSALEFASAVGAITTTRAGAIPALPTRAEVDAFLNSNSNERSDSQSAGRTPTNAAVDSTTLSKNAS